MKIVLNGSEERRSWICGWLVCVLFDYLRRTEKQTWIKDHKNGEEDGINFFYRIFFS